MDHVHAKHATHKVLMKLNVMDYAAELSNTKNTKCDLLTKMATLEGREAVVVQKEAEVATKMEAAAIREKAAAEMQVHIATNTQMLLSLFGRYDIQGVKIYFVPDNKHLLQTPYRQT